MGINHLQLSPQLIAALYPESLVGLNDPESGVKRIVTAPSLQEPEPVYPHLGKNIRSICFLVSYPEDEFIPDDQLDFLLKILNACKCNLEDIALINSAHTPVKMENLKNFFNPRIIFLWGSIPAGMDEINGFQDMSVTMLGNISVVPVLLADQLNRDNQEGKELKQRLWVLLKKLFGL